LQKIAKAENQVHAPGKSFADACGFKSPIDAPASDGERPGDLRDGLDVLAIS
jgi:hypothetical protein